MRTDIFGLTPRQRDMFGGEEQTLDTPMTAEEIRAELTRTLDLLRASEMMPWPVRQELQIRTMFPDIASKLPRDEAEALTAAFDEEMRRLRREAA